MNLSDRYNVQDHSLFASSEAQSGQVVKKVAVFRIARCQSGYTLVR